MVHEISAILALSFIISAEAAKPTQDSPMTVVQKNFLKGDQKNPDAQRSMITRAAHARPYGCYEAYFRVDPSVLPVEYRQGLFAKKKTYKAWVRISQASGKTQGSDKDRDQFGMAIKVLGPSGPSALNSNEEVSVMDFLLTNRPTTFIKTPAEQMEMFRRAGENKMSMMWFFLKHLNRVPHILRDTGRKLKSLRTESFWSRTPFLLWNENDPLPKKDDEVGTGAVKYVVWPEELSPGEANELTKKEVKEKSDTYLLTDLNETLKTKKVVYGFGIQAREENDNKKFPLNNPMELWKSAVQQAATLEIPARQLDHIDAALKHDAALKEGKVITDFCERLAFNPWNTRMAHTPYGEMNAARKAALTESQSNRAASGNYKKIITPDNDSFTHL